MIKKVKIIKVINGKYKTPVVVFELSPPMNISDNYPDVKYLTGGFYRMIPHSMAAFFISDKDGNIIVENPVISEEFTNTYEEIFEERGYIFI